MQTTKTITFALCSILLASPLFAQHLHFPLDASPVTIDGVMNASEWANANSIVIPVNGTDNVQVKFKHDNTAMYFAFYGKLESANALFPEVLTDAANAGGSAWQAGQWWLHVSATDCEHNGAYGVYDNCKAVQPDWTGAPNFDMTPPNTDTVEIRIPFGKIGFNTANMDTMGMALMVTNTATIFKTYPASSDRNVPSTWAKATFGKFASGIINTVTSASIKLYPNPAGNVINISGLPLQSIVSIRDITGRIFYKTIASDTSLSIPVDAYPKGIYLVHVSDKQQVICRKQFLK